MSILFNQNLNRKLAPHIQAQGLQCDVAQSRGPDGCTKWPSFERRRRRFDVLMTMDKNIPFQNNLSHRKLALLIVCLHIDELEEHLRYVPQAAELLRRIQPGAVEHVGHNDMVMREKSRYARIRTPGTTQSKRILP